MLKKSLQSAGVFSFAALLAFGCLGAASAKANIFSINAIDTNLDVLTGTVTIDTIGGAITGAAVNVSGQPNPFTLFIASGNTAYLANFYLSSDDFVYLDLAPSSLVGYTGGAIAPDSYVDIYGPTYLLSGTLSDSPAPEPAFYGMLTLGVVGLLFAARRHRRA